MQTLLSQPSQLATSGSAATVRLALAEAQQLQADLHSLFRIHEDRCIDAGHDWQLIAQIDADELAAMDAIAQQFTASLQATNYAVSLDRLF